MGTTAAASVLIREPGPRTHLNPNSTSWELVRRGRTAAIGVPSTEHHVRWAVRGDGDASNPSLRIAARELPPLCPRALHRGRGAQGQTAEGGSGARGTQPGAWAAVGASLLVLRRGRLPPRRAPRAGGGAPSGGGGRRCEGLAAPPAGSSPGLARHHRAVRRVRVCLVPGLTVSPS